MNSIAATTNGVKLKFVVAVDLGDAVDRLRDRADDRDQADVLLQRDEIVEQRRDDAPDRLGQDDQAQVWRWVSPSDRAAARWLRMHRLDARPRHLGDVRAVGDDERDARPRTAPSS